MALVGRRKARGLLGKWKSKKARGARNNGSKKRPAPKVVVWRGFSRFSIMAYSKSPEQDICCICGDDDRMEHLCPYNHIFGRYFSDTCRGECPPGEHRITPRARRKFLRRFVRVSNLPPGFRVWELEGLFSPFGPLLMWDIPRLPGDMCRGCRTVIRMSFGYLVFKKREDGKRAIDELNGYEARGHKLRVDWVYPSCV